MSKPWTALHGFVFWSPAPHPWLKGQLWDSKRPKAVPHTVGQPYRDSQAGTDMQGQTCRDYHVGKDTWGLSCEDSYDTNHEQSCWRQDWTCVCLFPYCPPCQVSYICDVKGFFTEENSETWCDGWFTRAPHCLHLDFGPRIDLLAVCVCGLKPLFVTLQLAPISAVFRKQSHGFCKITDVFIGGFQRWDVVLVWAHGGT